MLGPGFVPVSQGARPDNDPMLGAVVSAVTSRSSLERAVQVFSNWSVT